MKYTLCLLTLLLGGCISHYSNYQYDNGDDYVSEGTVRIVNDDNGKIGYATPDGIILIEPQYAFGYPFKNGRAKVTYEGGKPPGRKFRRRISLLGQRPMVLHRQTRQ